MAKIIYIGIFLNAEIKGSMPIAPKDGQHVTLAFRPTPDQLAALEPMYGTRVECRVVGYGNDGNNEGIAVEFDGVPYFTGLIKHITLSLSPGAKPLNTAKLDFGPNIPEHIPNILYGEIKPFCG